LFVEFIGQFKQSPANHLTGRGCKQCAIDSSGFNKTSWTRLASTSKDFDSFKVYIIKCFSEDTDEKFIKIGRTFLKVQNRFGLFGGNTRFPYKYTILKEYTYLSAEKCWQQELNLHNKYKSYKYIPLISFGGMYECFNMEIIDEFL
jgi:hypothetical protein